MGQELPGMNAKVEAMEAATTADEWYDALIDVIESGLLSDRNGFGKLALESLQVSSIRAGTVIPWAGTASAIPSGWLLCDGRRVNRSAYPDLAENVRTKFGAYSAITVALPDLRRKVVIGWGGFKPNHSAGPDNRIGATGGNETVTLGSATIPAHGHLLAGSATGGMELVAVGSHTHQCYEFTTQATGGGGNFVARRDYLFGSSSATALTDAGDRHIHFLGGDTDSAGSASPAPITVSGTRVCMNWIIKT